MKEIFEIGNEPVGTVVKYVYGKGSYAVWLKLTAGKAQCLNNSLVDGSWRAGDKVYSGGFATLPMPGSVAVKRAFILEDHEIAPYASFLLDV